MCHAAPQIRTPKGGHVYRGGVLKGMKQGLGQLEYSNGCKYDGEFDADEMDGHGVFTFASGGLYQGQVVLLWWTLAECQMQCCWKDLVVPNHQSQTMSAWMVTAYCHCNCLQFDMGKYHGSGVETFPRCRHAQMLCKCCDYWKCQVSMDTP